MKTNIANSPAVGAYLDRISGLSSRDGDPRTKQITRRIVSDLFRTIEIEPTIRLSTAQTVLVNISFVPQRLDVSDP